MTPASADAFDAARPRAAGHAMPDCGELAIGPIRRIPGPLESCATSDFEDFDRLLNGAAQRVPVGEWVDVMDVVYTCAFLATPYARRVSGGTLDVDGGVNMMA